MIAKYTKAKSLIFDGSESEVLNKSFDLDTEIDVGAAIQFNDFAGNNFEDLQQVIGDDDFKAIVTTGEFAPDGGFLNIYKNSDNLRLYFCKRGNVIIVFAYGEFQPTRYKLYMEGIWICHPKAG
jgi:hypothetical protein